MSQVSEDWWTGPETAEITKAGGHKCSFTQVSCCAFRGGCRGTDLSKFNWLDQWLELLQLLNLSHGSHVFFFLAPAELIQRVVSLKYCKAMHLSVVGCVIIEKESNVCNTLYLTYLSVVKVHLRPCSWCLIMIKFCWKDLNDLPEKNNSLILQVIWEFIINLLIQTVLMVSRWNTLYGHLLISLSSHRQGGLITFLILWSKKLNFLGICPRHCSSQTANSV